MRRYNGVALWAAVLVAAVVWGFLSSSRAPGGELEPSAPPAKSMHTLDEIYANTAGVVIPPEALATAHGPAYLEVDGIDGGVPEGDYHDWIAIFGFAHDMEFVRDLSGGGTGTSKVQMAPVVVTKEWDKASPLLALKCCQGDLITEVKIEWPKAERELSLRLTLKEVVITRISPRLVFRGDGFVLMEEVALSFAKIKWEHWDDLGRRTEAGWNLITNSEL